MRTINKLITLLFILLTSVTFAQKTPSLIGIIIDEEKKPVEGIVVYYTSAENVTSEAKSDRTGFYKLDLPLRKLTRVWYKHPDFKGEIFIDVPPMKDGELLEFNFTFIPGMTQTPEVIIGYDGRKRVEGLMTVDREVIKNVPSLTAGVEGILKLMFASGSNEMSSQYTVRGGNYDENLVYVNDVEIYRPFLVRSGQQEGLSFTNTHMVESVDFSAGGFQSRFGDKMSSVLDVKYRKPVTFGAAAEASFLGGSLTLENASKNGKWTEIIGGRYRNNSLLVNSQQTETNYKPIFVDVQTSVTYQANEKLSFNFLGNIAQNNYDYQPLYRQTNFGTISDPIALQIFYDGQEKDRYRTFFGATTADYLVSDTFRLKFIGSAYHTQEQEHFDILAQYALGDVDTNIGSETFGDIQFARAVGSQLNHGRNDLDALIANAEVKGYHNIKKGNIEWGAKYTREDFRDRLVEWEVIDSAGFSIRPPVIDYVPNDQPYAAYTGPLVPYQSVRATNFVVINRLSGYGQINRKFEMGKSRLLFNGGVRLHQWQVNGASEPGKSQVVISPRVQFALKPGWENTDVVFRLSGGRYSQPPFYRELRDSIGVVRPNVKAQNSYHVVLGSDYSFLMKNRPYKFVAEAYYKAMNNINTYTLENVRIRYKANNDAVAYAYGLDMRLNGEIVPGTESWVTFGYMKTEENYQNKGYVARPTDQRLKFAVLFQDYVPNMPNIKVYLNMMYNTGLPGGSPSYADVYKYQSRLNDYRRADIGFSYVFADAKIRPKSGWMAKMKELSLGLEIFNMFNNQNAITNTWVRDVYTKQEYGIPNYLTSRVFSLKLAARI